MENEILDAPDHKPDRNKYNYLIPYAILCIGMMISALLGWLSDLEYQVGLGGLIVTGIAFYVHKKTGVFVNGVLLFLGIINVAEFFPIEYSVGFGIGDFFLGINIINLFTAAFFLHFNMEDFKSQFQKLFYANAEQINAKELSRISNFKRRFEHKTIEELNVIANNFKLVEAAREAAKELIIEKEAAATEEE